MGSESREKPWKLRNKWSHTYLEASGPPWPSYIPTKVPRGPDTIWLWSSRTWFAWTTAIEKSPEPYFPTSRNQSNPSFPSLPPKLFPITPTESSLSAPRPNGFKHTERRFINAWSIPHLSETLTLTTTPKTPEPSTSLRSYESELGRKRERAVNTEVMNRGEMRERGGKKKGKNWNKGEGCARRRLRRRRTLGRGGGGVCSVVEEHERQRAHSPVGRGWCREDSVWWCYFQCLLLLFYFFHFFFVKTKKCLAVCRGKSLLPFHFNVLGLG